MHLAYIYRKDLSCVIYIGRKVIGKCSQFYENFTKGLDFPVIKCYNNYVVRSKYLVLELPECDLGGSPS